MNTINRRSVLPFAALVALMFPGVVLQTLAQTARERLVGTWMLVSIYVEGPDGSRFDPFGADPTGILIIDRSGRISVQFIDSDLPKFASNDRLEGAFGGINIASVNGLVAWLCLARLYRSEIRCCRVDEISGFRARRARYKSQRDLSGREFPRGSGSQYFRKCQQNWFTARPRS